jgi:hypothetical protein
MQACRCGSGSAESSLTALLHQTSAYRDSFVGFTMGPGGVNLVTVNLPIGLSQSERYYCESLQLITHLTRKHMNSIDTLRDAVHSDSRILRRRCARRILPNTRDICLTRK